MTRFAVPENASLGVKMTDGTVYMPSRTGTIDVTDEFHVKQLRGKSIAKELDMIIESGAMPQQTATGTKECAACLFVAWEWSTECPRCGSTL